MKFNQRKKRFLETFANSAGDESRRVRRWERSSPAGGSSSGGGRGKTEKDLPQGNCWMRR